MTTDKAAAPVGEFASVIAEMRRKADSIADYGVSGMQGKSIIDDWCKRLEAAARGDGPRLDPSLAAAPVGAVPQGDDVEEAIRDLLKGANSPYEYIYADDDAATIRAALASQAARMGELIDAASDYRDKVNHKTRGSQSTHEAEIRLIAAMKLRGEAG